MSADEKPKQEPGDDTEQQASVEEGEGQTSGNATPAGDAEASDSSATGDGPSGGA